MFVSPIRKGNLTLRPADFKDKGKRGLNQKRNSQNTQGSKRKAAGGRKPSTLVVEANEEDEDDFDEKDDSMSIEDSSSINMADSEEQSNRIMIGGKRSSMVIVDEVPLTPIVKGRYAKHKEHWNMILKAAPKMGRRVSMLMAASEVDVEEEKDSEEVGEKQQ